jgi:hypothetical protein
MPSPLPRRAVSPRRPAQAAVAVRRLPTWPRLRGPAALTCALLAIACLAAAAHLSILVAGTVLAAASVVLAPGAVAAANDTSTWAWASPPGRWGRQVAAGALICGQGALLLYALVIGQRL